MTWMLFWKIVFLVTVIGFGGMAVWVSVQGARDIKSMFKTLREEHEEQSGQG